MTMDKLTIEKAHKGLIKKEFSAIELAEFYLNKIKKENEKYNDFISITEDLALKQAKSVDDKLSRGEKIGDLEGIPMAIKDNILIDDCITTAGSKILENYGAVYDAAVIKKLRGLGVVFLGKTNLDEFAMGSSTENSAFGVVKNPVDVERVPGGSSGGSAAAVAADHCLGALGSDTGGSIRQPAAFCGVIGFKPSYGAVSRYGLIAMASSLDQIGPIAKNVLDAKLIFNSIKGKDKMDSTTLDINDKEKDYGVLKIGVPKEYFQEGISSEVKNIIEKEIKKFEKMGHEVKEVSLPSTEYALAVYYIIMPAEASANLARFDGIKYGKKGNSGENLIDFYSNVRAAGFGDEVRRRIMLGTYTLSAGYKEAYYKKAQAVRGLIKKELENVFKSVDILLTPTTPSTAFKIGEKEDPLSMYLSDIYTVTVNLAGLPAISVPCGRVDKLPVGLQIIGPQFKDNLVLSIAQSYEQLRNL
ncbi:MAG: Asp-tRNA(Asn)/Glu-tRNA(Gln) amidotransferase subunit GatA [Candidatus Portnoybacteria bacterium]|nr:Asp-tRNA(Asn)/Glu-tRNA(Gln) amidotransferase subunit GatA [Candidatus Portnoybacteria bacterium]